MKGPLQSSNFLIGINILVLGLFLLFWLRSEYRNEKSVLMQEAGLEVAEQLILIGGLDLDSILQQFRAELGDSFNMDRGGTTIIRKDYTTNHVAEMGPTDDRHSNHGEDTLISLSIRNEPSHPSDSLSATYSIVISDDGSGGLDSMNITANLRDNYRQNTEDISRQALMNIGPQIGFALLLFALSLLAIYLLRRMNRERQFSLQSKNNMISNITHELKTPVSTIGVALEAIQDFDVHTNPEKTSAYLKTSRLELARLSGLIDQILQFGKIDQGAEHFEFQEHSLKDVLAEATETMQIQADAKGAHIALEAIGTDWDVSTDRLHLKSAFVNLIDNSLKYGPEGVQIHLSAKKENGQFICTFRDSGPGIPKEYQSKVFDRFFRIQNGDTHNVKGSGLGLSYVAEIVHAHQGSIDLHSKEGEGTIIEIKLPAIDA